MIIEQRAAAIIFNTLMSLGNEKIFILPSNVCPIVPITFMKAKQKFEFIDISNDTLCIDEEVVLNKLNNEPEKYSGVFFVRTYGISDSFENFFEKIKNINNNFIIFDDRCLSIPNINYIKTCADVVLYSTGYSKIVDLGFGGFAQIKENIEYYKFRTSHNEESHKEIINQYKNSITNKTEFIYNDCDWLDNGESSNSNEYYFSLLKKKYRISIDKKKKINKIYSDNLPSSIKLGDQYQMWRYNIRVPNKVIILEKLLENNLFASSHYASLHGIFSAGYSPNAEHLHSNILNLFNDNYFSELQAYKATEIINDNIKKGE